MLEINNLTKYYHNGKQGLYLALKDISFKIQKGEIVCIVGPSGSGKTTILKCLTGLDKDCHGNIRVNWQASTDYLKQNRIALVSQSYSNFPWLTVRENVVAGLYGKKKTKIEINDLTNDLLKRVGLFKFKDHYVEKLSGGMKQRVAIARAIAEDTDIIALDEPFGALDVQTRAKMQDLLAKLWEEEGKTMILVTHDIDEAVYLADRIYVLGANPGTIKKVVDVDIPRPRKPEIRFQENFIKTKMKIRDLI